MSKVGRPKKPLTQEERIFESAKSIVNSLPPALREKIDGVMDDQIGWTKSMNSLWTRLRSDGVTEDCFIGDPDSEGVFPVLSATSTVRLNAAEANYTNTQAIKMEGRRAGGDSNSKRCGERRNYIAKTFPRHVRMGLDGSQTVSNLATLILPKWLDAECPRPAHRTLRRDLSVLIKKLAEAS